MNAHLTTCGAFVEQRRIDVSDEQRIYEAYHSPEQRAKRRADMEAHRENAVTAALALYNSGDHDGARIKLQEACIDMDGVELYLRSWR